MRTEEEHYLIAKYKLLFHEILLKYNYTYFDEYHEGSNATTMFIGKRDWSIEEIKCLGITITHVDESIYEFAVNVLIKSKPL